MLMKTEVEFRSLRNRLSPEGYRCIYRRMLDEACPQCGFMSMARASYAKGDDIADMKYRIRALHS